MTLAVCLLLLWAWVLIVARSCPAPFPFETPEEFRKRRFREIARKTVT
jgi:hypothetical protein